MTFGGFYGILYIVNHRFRQGTSMNLVLYRLKQREYAEGHSSYTTQIWNIVKQAIKFKMSSIQGLSQIGEIKNHKPGKLKIYAA